MCHCALQQDITRGRDMVDSLYQGKGVGSGGTHNAVLSSEDYLNTAARNLNNIEEGFYISPAFLDKLSIHVAKNFLDLPKIKVPLILGRPAFGTLQDLSVKLCYCESSFHHKRLILLTQFRVQLVAKNIHDSQFEKFPPITQFMCHLLLGSLRTMEWASRSLQSNWNN